MGLDLWHDERPWIRREHAALSVIDGGAVIQGTKFPLCPGVDLIQKGATSLFQKGTAEVQRGWKGASAGRPAARSVC
jgi:hypothetical protein